MKKILAGIATIAVVGVGGVLVLGQEKEEPKKEADIESVVSSSEAVEKEEVVEIPTQRTVEENAPWQTDNNLIKQWHEQGETVFIWSDAEQVEQRMIDVSGIDPNAEEFKNAPVGKTDITSIAAETLGLYIKEVSQYVENEAYFAKLEEVQQAMANEQFDSVPTLIEEAKSLRESE